ncbi:hypothetical protein GFS31_43670 (plasmid) [Leptolyngbya sp. BL0902]|nr:hypothetical protein GFS31_43670 [Leptolyngbya sp. BL0902]
MDWSYLARGGAARDEPLVSIPERVWGGLELAFTLVEKYQEIVSIPERVWGGLERPLRCSIPAGVQGVSIPERVWGGLERRASESLVIFSFQSTKARTPQF